MAIIMNHLSIGINELKLRKRCLRNENNQVRKGFREPGHLANSYQLAWDKKRGAPSSQFEASRQLLVHQTDMTFNEISLTIC